MDYVTRYTDLIYFANGDIGVCRYRLLTFNSDPKQVVVQIDNHRGSKDAVIADHRIRDAILNRIANRELEGVPFAMLCVALTANSEHHVLFVEPDLEDYIHRGYPYQRTPERAARGRHIERISIDSRNLVIGRARIQTAHATPTPPDADFAALLNHPGIV
ncbi:hypothetical protein WJ47_12500 [Burkholderia ubonensis]|uniref:Uncharacterized protein n=2 Tax=Burkholderia ubonensis TaxID=101571 RepID=A0AB73FS45_9BURK|nr:hypothetical protein [Burkholderia ubonensis]KVK87641.1 hypothetical protein WJ44_32970 [Burkholderia ubonensis]KVL66169.1 hypothetical protein WJ47_12500 [Burkholderia ubonensis]KVM19904.1 hypothetical protein WJ53_22570 [Burkholderia ubonensis]KVM26789.1 hypothetical protein WJ54_16185 [Burkholderia ubonensis]OJB08149.1 hypothetical protein BGV52_17985 [Burkholderia ubonensis]